MSVSSSHIRAMGPVTLALVGLCWLMTHHGAIRSPDGEVQFRACEALATEGTAAVPRELTWRGFGLATGKDGGRYSVFGPLQPVLCVPAYWASAAISADGETGPWSDKHLRGSLYAEGHVLHHVQRRPLQTPERHRLRAWLSFYNVVVGLWALWALAWALSAEVGSRAAWLTAFVFGTASVLWPYAGTFFGEWTSLGFLHLAVGGALRCDRSSARWGGLVGLSLGLAVCAHVSAILWLPFCLGLMACRMRGRDGPGARQWLALGLGFALIVSVLGALQWSRYGDVFETGRSVDAVAAARFGYGKWSAPWPAVWALWFGAGKGLLLYCPLVVLGLYALWRERRSPVAWLLGGALVFRWLFISCRSDWHGGFGLGPRLMLLALPALTWPIARMFLRLMTQQAGLGRRIVAAWIGLCAGQQAWFAMGEPYAWFQLAYRAFVAKGIDPFTDARLYLDWGIAPLLNLHHGPIGPWWAGAEHRAIWAVLPIMVGVLVSVAVLRRTQPVVDPQRASV